MDTTTTNTLTTEGSWYTYVGDPPPLGDANWFTAQVPDTYDNLQAERIAFDAQYQRRLQALRKICPHTTYKLMYYSWRMGCMELMRVCEGCGNNLGVPSAEETKTFKQTELAETEALWAKNYPEFPMPESIRRNILGEPPDCNSVTYTASTGDTIEGLTSVAGIWKDREGEVICERVEGEKDG